MFTLLRHSNRISFTSYQVTSRTLITTENIVETAPGKKQPANKDSSSSSSSSVPSSIDSDLTASEMSLTYSEPLPHYDIVINGGGIVGLSFLLYLQKSPLLADRKILLLESQKDRPGSNLGELVNQERKLSNRVSCLTLSSKQFFHNLDIWSSLVPFAKPTRSMHVWSDKYLKGVTFTPHRISFMDNIIKTERSQLPEDENLCYIIENSIILSSLREKVKSDSIKFDTKLVNIEALPGDTTVELTLSDESKISASLLVGCDGFDSFVRQSSDTNYFNVDLSQSAIVGTVQISRESDLDENDVSFQRFVLRNDHILAILPLTPNFASFVLSVPRNQLNGLMELSDEAFVNILNEDLFLEKNITSNQSLLSIFKNTCDSVLEKILTLDSSSTLPRINPPQVMSIEPDSRASFPLKFGTSLPKIVGTVKGGDKQKCILIGDSAHRVHPLAGQGLNLGLGDAEVLGQYLDEALSNGEDLFAHNESSREQLNQVLYNVERGRQFKLLAMMMSIHTMQSLFTNLPTNVFAAFNKLNFAKNEIVRFANSR